MSKQKIVASSGVLHPLSDFEQNKSLTEFLYVPNAKPAKELSKHDQKMIQLGWDAHRTLRLDRPDREKNPVTKLVEGMGSAVANAINKANEMRDKRIIEEARREERERIRKVYDDAIAVVPQAGLAAMLQALKEGDRC